MVCFYFFFFFFRLQKAKAPPSRAGGPDVMNSGRVEGDGGGGGGTGVRRGARCAEASKKAQPWRARRGRVRA